MQLHQLLYEITKSLKRHICFQTPDHYLIIALYVILSYCQDEVDAVPYVHLMGAPASGKSTLLKMIELLGYRPVYAVRITDAAVVRAIDQQHGLFILDEAEELSRRRVSNDLKKIFLNGYKKGGYALICDTDREGLIMRTVYGAKITAYTSDIYDRTMASRFIILRMEKPEPGKRPQKFYLATHGEDLKQIAHSLDQLFRDQVMKQRVRDAYIALGEIDGLANRDEELMSPLLALARLIDEEIDRDIIFGQVLKFAKLFLEERKTDDFFTHWPTRIIHATWEYLRGNQDIYPSDKFVPGDKIREHVARQLQPRFALDVRYIGRILDNNGLLDPPKRRLVWFKTKDGTKKHATAFLINRDKLARIAEQYDQFIVPPDGADGSDKDTDIFSIS